MPSSKKRSKFAHTSGIPGTEHRGSVDLVEVIRKVAPFLFAKKTKARTVLATTSKKKIVKRTSTKRPMKHVRKAVHTLAVRKTVAPKKMTEGASHTVVSERPAARGKIVDMARKESSLTQVEITAEKEALLHEKGWMEKIALAQKSSAPVKKRSAWAHFADRFGGSHTTEKENLKQAKAEEAADIKESLKDDQFLNRVQQKRSDSVVGTSTDDPAASLPPDLGIRPSMATSALEDFASGNAPADPSVKSSKGAPAPKGKIISAAQLKKEAEESKEASRRILEETKKDMKQETQQETMKKEAESRPAEEVKRVRPLLHKESNGWQKFAASFSHFGLGKLRMQFTENLATMLNAGLPLVDALQTLLLEVRNKPMKKIIGRIVDMVENGSPLWRAMDSEDLFSLHAIALIRIGEEAGSLAENMEYLSAQETKDHELVQKVKMAMIYPTIVMAIMFIIVMGLGLFVLPNLIGVLTSLNVPLPFVTRCIIGFSNAFTEHGAVIVPGSLGAILVFVLLAKFTSFGTLVQWVTFRIPGIGTLLRSATIARFGVILGGLLKAGVPVVDAMQSLVQVTSIVVYRRLYENMRDHIMVGDSFAKTFAAIHNSEKLLPISVQQLVITGEKSGALAEITLKIANIYDKKASETAQKLPVILEPILLLIIGSLVGTIALGIIVPIYSIVGSVGM